jgi:hypothetical protein
MEKEYRRKEGKEGIKESKNQYEGLRCELNNLPLDFNGQFPLVM